MPNGKKRRQPRQHYNLRSQKRKRDENNDQAQILEGYDRGFQGPLDGSWACDLQGNLGDSYYFDSGGVQGDCEQLQRDEGGVQRICELQRNKGGGGYLMPRGEQMGYRIDSLPKFDGTQDANTLEQWIGIMDGYMASTEMSNKEKLWFASSFLSKEARKWWAAVDQASKNANVPFCSSWQGFKKKLRKQFIPFNFVGEAVEDLELLRQNRIKAPEYCKRFSKRLEQFKEMDARIQDDIKKSAFMNSVREFKLREELEASHRRNFESLESQKAAEVSKVEMGYRLGVLSLEAEFSKKACKQYGKRQSNLLKENIILRKLLGRIQEEREYLLKDRGGKENINV